MEKKDGQKIILGIETSCDDTCASVVVDGEKVLSNIISSQVKSLEKYGGVVPEVAARDHIKIIPFVVKEALQEAGIKQEDLTAIAVTKLPGLTPSLVVGQSFASGLAESLDIPLLEINHLEAHIYANYLTRGEKKKIEYPYVALLVSGRHSELWVSNGPRDYKMLGRTRDDAAGEAFDKVARMLDLGFPGGPAIDKLSQTDADPEAIDLPRPMIDSEDYDFSFSGLKTAVKLEVDKYEKGEAVNHPILNSKNHDPKSVHKDLSASMKEFWVKDLAASFQEAVVDVLVYKTIDAAQMLGIDTITVGGGVAANTRLRDKLIREAHNLDYDVFFPDFEFCLDNGEIGRAHV